MILFPYFPQQGGNFTAMKKLLSLLMAVAMLSALAAALPACSLPKRTSDSVHLDYILNSDKKSYDVLGSNITGQTSFDRWEPVDLVIPDTHGGLPVTGVRPFAFEQSEVLRSVTLPESMNTVSGLAFVNCANLESVHISSGVESIFGGSFARCFSLQTVTVDPANPHYTLADGSLYTKDGKTLILYPPGKTDTRLEIPEGVTALGRSAISHCTHLEEIAIPATVTDIPYEAVEFCTGLRGVTVSEENPVYRSIDGNLYSKDGTVFLRLCVSTENTALTVPEGVTEIADHAACYADHLTAVTLPDSVTSIGEFAFFKTGLTSLHVPSGVTFMGEKAFDGCERLTEAVFEAEGQWEVIPCGGKFTANAVLATKGKLSDATKAAEYLTKTYAYYEWHWQE